MPEIRIELVPGRPAVCSDGTVTLDVLVKVAPPLPDVHFPRPPLNVALVLDRSGSMASARKMAHAREAAEFAVRQLLPTDRVSVTAFDDRVETVVPGAPAADRAGIVRRIEGIEPRGSTDLHAGWAEGGKQALGGLAPGGVNRVLLLSDGLANHGLTDPNAIAAEARGLAARGVTTTTLGVGDDYNEDLMQALARAGDGHYYYIESPAQLADIFQTELQGLIASAGQTVSLGLEPGDGVAVSDVLNDFEALPNGRYKLPPLVAGLTVSVVVRLTVPPQKAGLLDLFAVRLAWDDPRGGGRRVTRATLGGLPAVPSAAWSDLPAAPEVREQEALLMAARAQKEASLAHERGDFEGTASYLSESRSFASALPDSPECLAELQAIQEIEEALRSGSGEKVRKLSKYRSYLRQSGRSSLPSTEPGTAPPEPPKKP